MHACRRKIPFFCCPSAAASLSVQLLCFMFSYLYFSGFTCFLCVECAQLGLVSLMPGVLNLLDSADTRGVLLSSDGFLSSVARVLLTLTHAQPEHRYDLIAALA